MGLSAALTVHDLQEQARRRVPRMFFEYADLSKASVISASCRAGFGNSSPRP